MKIKGINTDKFTPLEVVQKLKWDKMRRCIVIFEDQDTEDGSVGILRSTMSLSNQIWLLQCAKDVYYLDMIRINKED